MLVLGALIVLGAAPRLARASVMTTDVVVYGATPGGVMAAITAARAGAGVELLEPSQHVGGMMSSGGLTWTDIGDVSTLGGYTREFFDRVQAIEGGSPWRYRFEPHVAELAFNAMLTASGVSLRLGETLEPSDVETDGGRIVSLGTTSGDTFAAQVYIDASYEGDLLAAAGVSYVVGREDAGDTAEGLAGVRPTGVIMKLPPGVDAGYTTSPPGPVGSGDERIQDSNYRICFSSDPANRVPFIRPPGYAASHYAVVTAYLATRQASTGLEPDLSWLLAVMPVANQKFDVNTGGAVSAAITGANYAWPEGDAATRTRTALQHESWERGLLYFLANDLGVPLPIRVSMASYGLCGDEWADNGNWPRLLYLREGRRMVGAYVMTQRDVTSQRSKADIVGVASYRIDSHGVSRWVDASDRLLSEGGISAPYFDYAIPYRALTPRSDEVTNLLVPVAISATHVAYASFRMEPHYMLAGEAAGMAAWLALPHGSGSGRAVQEIDVSQLQANLRANGSFLKNLGSRGWG